MELSLEALIEAIDDADREKKAKNTAVEEAKDARHQRKMAARAELCNIRNQIEIIFRLHNPKKLRDINMLMEKYAGKERELLVAVQDKYYADNKWSFVLKNYNNLRNTGDSKKCQKKMWRDEESLSSIKKVLDELAQSIGGICKDGVTKDGHRQLIVVQKSIDEVCDIELVKGTVGKMRVLIHTRYRGNNQAPQLANEHDRRNAEQARGRRSNSKSKAQTNWRDKKGRGWCWRDKKARGW